MSWTIRYENLSSQTLRLTNFGGVTEDVVGEVDHQPKSSLGTGESDYLELDQNAMKFIASGGIDIYQGVCAQHQTLWVRIHVPVQVFGFGTSPYWYTQINDGADPGLGTDGWDRHDSDSPELSFAGLKASFSPDKDHSNLTVSVSIDDA